MALLAADYCRQVIDLLAEYDEEAAESANSTMVQVGAVALGALLGAVFGGRMGAVAGSAVGTAAGAVAVPNYKPLAQCYNELDNDQKEDLARRIQNKVGNPFVAALKEFARNPENIKWLQNAIRSS